MMHKCACRCYVIKFLFFFVADQNGALAGHLIWAIGQFMPICEEYTVASVDAHRSPDTHAALNVLRSDQLELIESLELVILSSTRRHHRGSAENTEYLVEATLTRTQELQCLALSSLSKLAAQFSPLKPRMQLLLQKVLSSSSTNTPFIRRAKQCLGSLSETSIASALFFGNSRTSGLWSAHHDLPCTFS